MRKKLRNFIKIASIAVISTIVVLFILGKMGIAYFNMPILEKGFEKGKAVLKIDAISKLLKLEYPSIGDTTDLAYAFFQDIAFESEDQIDFYILDNRQKIYVNYNPDTNLIDSMKLYLEGDISKILVLGEKMLPYRYSYIDEESFTTEKLNEIGRYTKTEYIHEYYYELPETNQYGLISISRSTNDLFGKKDSDSTDDYKLEISFVSREKIGSNQEIERNTGWETTNSGVIDNDTESPIEQRNDDENDNYDTEFDQPEEPSHEVMSGYYESDNRDTKDGTLVILDESLLINAGYGRINGIDVSLGDNIEKVISKLGAPILDYSMPEFGTVSLGYGGYTIQGAEVNTIRVDNTIIQPLLSQEEVKKVFGEPIEEWRSSDYLHMSYETGGYYLYLDFNEEGTEIEELILERGY